MSVAWGSANKLFIPEPASKNNSGISTAIFISKLLILKKLITNKVEH